ncbi:MAG TPA: hypothetical protein VJ744_09745 [Gaiellaceae bacterium]|nr:hypothetical protein [Gaiellaceae bacterium]
MRTRLLALAIIALVALVPATARADGLPVEGVDASLSGVATAPVNGVRYVTPPAGRKTLIAAVDVDNGRLLRSRLLVGRFTVPVVAYDGSASGLSADGKTLVLIQPRRSFPRRTTTFAVLGAKDFRLREVFTLRGDFSFDALSPDGRWLYLVEYLSPRDPSRYLVRLYDMRAHRLTPDPIIDPREVGDVMRGMPVTRSYSPDERFAYTLYDGAGEHPFIHALDTVEKSARCIDLHGLMGFSGLGGLKLDVSPDSGSIAVVFGRNPVAFVDTGTNQVTGAPPAAPEGGSSGAPIENDPRSVPWLFIALGAAVLVLVLLGAQRLLKGGLRRGVPQPPEMLGGVGGEIELELEDALLNDVPEPKRPRVPVA